MKKEYKALITSLLKPHGFKTIGDYFYVRVEDKLVYFNVVVCKSVVNTSIYYKKASHDNILWNILGLEGMDGKKDSEKIVGAHHLPSTLFRRYGDPISDPDCLEEILNSRLSHIVQDDLIEIAPIDVNADLINGETSERTKAIAYIDSEQIDTAIQIAKQCISQGIDGGVRLNSGKTFFHLLLERYSCECVEAQPSKSVPQGSKIIDDAEWHFDSAMKANFGLRNNAEKVYRLAGAHIAYYLAWIVEHDGLSELVPESEIIAVKNRESTPTDLLINTLDGKLLIEDIAASMREFVIETYESTYYDDYDAFLDMLGEPLWVSEFSWERYSYIEPMIDACYAKWKNRKE